MNWDAIGSVAELMGAAGVIASLSYLAVQIRQSTRTERARAFQDLFSEHNAHNHEMFGRENVDLIVSGLLDISGLSGGDRLRFDHLMIGYINAIESTLFSKGAYLLGDDTMDNWSYIMRTRFLPYPGMRDWWSEACAIFTPETCAWVDAQIELTDTNSDFLRMK